MMGHGQVIVARLRRVLFKRVEMIILALEIILLKVAQRLAVSTGLVCATMSINLISMLRMIGT
jgi:hypothetical protein